MVTQVESGGDEEAKGVEESFELPCSLLLKDFRECCMFGNYCHNLFKSTFAWLHPVQIWALLWLQNGLYICIRAICSIVSNPVLKHSKFTEQRVSSLDSSVLHYL